MRFSLLLFALLFGLRLQSQDGALDTTFFGIPDTSFFGTPGYFTFNYGEQPEIVRDLHLYPDGRMIGAMQVNGISVGDIMLLKRNTHGGVDNSFNGIGRMMIDLGSVEDPISIAVLPNGSIYVLGKRNNVLFLARVLASGVLDGSYGQNGIVYLNIQTPGLTVGDIRLRSDGNLLSIGSYLENAQRFPATMVINPATGQLVSAYGDGGYFKAPFPIIEGRGAGAIVHQDSVIYASVFYDTTAIWLNTMGILRITPEGQLDTLFGDQGMAKTYFLSDQAIRTTGAERQQNGAIVMGLVIAGSLHQDYAAVRFMPNGELDTLFAGNGLAIHNVLVYDTPKDILVDHDDRILLIGNGGGTNQRQVIVRLNPDGSLDQSFGNEDGFQIQDYWLDGVSTTFGRLAADQKIVLAGSIKSTANSVDIYLHVSRFNQTCLDTQPLYLFADNDGDGFGDSSDSILVCGNYSPSGFVPQPGDCDDEDVSVFPGATELCDDLDNDCNGVSDDNMMPVYYYLDNDQDGFGSIDSLLIICDGTVPPGYEAQAGDCNDDDVAIYPNALEICNQTDDDCDNQIDNGLGQFTYYLDNDDDGYGGDISITTCEATVPAGFVLESGDCDDDCQTCYSGAEELCDYLDNNCDGQIDEGLLVWYYYDEDQDGYGSSEVSGLDCPGLDSQFYVTNNLDCVPQNPLIHPGAEEICDELDNNCSGQVDEGLELFTFYQDVDGDGYGDTIFVLIDCNQPVGYAPIFGDCAPDNEDIYPGATEIPNNGIDEDCDGADMISATYDLGGRKIEVYPNPVSSELFIQLPNHQNFRVELFNLQGRLIYATDNPNFISMDNLENGIYLLKIQDFSSIEYLTDKIVVEK